MKIGVVGSGVVAQQLGLGLIKLGHEVKLGTRDVSKLNEWKKQAGGKLLQEVMKKPQNLVI